MNCPCCGNTLMLPNHAVNNMENYGTPCTVATLCCGHAVHTYPIFTYRAQACTDGRTEDDWLADCKPYAPAPEPVA